MKLRQSGLTVGFLLSSVALSCVAVVGCSDDTTLVNQTIDSGRDALPSDVQSDPIADAQPDSTTVSDSGSDTGSSDASDASDASNATDASDGGRCTAAKEQLLKPIDSVSTGAIEVIATEGNARTLYIDATAGGVPNAPQNPRIYLNLATPGKVTVTDRSAQTSTGWDLALKRDVIFTNSGDGGPGGAGAVFLANKAFADVTAADAQGKDFAPENFFEEDCTAKRDDNGSVLTSFSHWYDYDMATHRLAPKVGTWLVRSAAGPALFKLQLLSYYSSPDGGTSGASAQFTVKVEAL